MTDKTDIQDLVDEITEIARTTTDPETARKLMELAHRLLTAAGLPPEDEAGGGGETPPTDRLMEPVFEPA
jgi:hypothetical protein